MTTLCSRCDILFGCYAGTKHCAYIIRESLQRTTALPLHCNYVWLPLPSVTKASHSLQTARLTRMWSRSLKTMHTSLCGATKKPSPYHT